MKESELTETRLAVLETVIEEPEPELSDVHQSLVDRTDTRFKRSPKRGAGWNDERREVQQYLRELQDNELIDADGRGSPWYPTQTGKEAVSVNRE